MLARTALHGIGRPLLWLPWFDGHKVGIVALLDGRIFLGAFKMMDGKR